MDLSVQEITQCRLCHNDKMVPVLSLGSQYVVDFVKTSHIANRGRAPLDMVRCERCHFVQLKHTVNQDVLYKKFWYRSDCNEQMIQALRDLADRAQEVAYVGQGDKVLDIGANNGVLLGWYPGVVRTVGVDPCKELIDEGLKAQKMDVGLIGFFSEGLVKPHGPFKIITAAGMFYDVNDPVGFLKQCKSVMTKDGVLIIQMNYLVTMLQNFAVDNVCHEHLGYYSMTAMKMAADMADLEIVGAEVNDVNGGSVRVYMTHKNSGLYGISTGRQLDLFMKAMDLVHKEMQMGLDTQAPYDQFAIGVYARIKALRNYLTRGAEAGEKIYIYGASTRGTVLMQMLNLPKDVIKGAAERDKGKFGLHMVGGTWPKIYSEDHCRADATVFLCLPWHYQQSIEAREVDFLLRGKSLVFPLPSPRVITRDRTYHMQLDVTCGVEQ